MCNKIVGQLKLKLYKEKFKEVRAKILYSIDFL